MATYSGKSSCLMRNSIADSINVKNKETMIKKFKRGIRAWLNDDTISENTISPYKEETYNIRIWNAINSKIVEIRYEDRSMGQYQTDLYTIQNTEDFSARLTQILVLSYLKS